MQLGVRAFFAVKSGQVPLSDAIDAKRKRDSEEEDKKEAKRKAKAKVLARKAKPAPGSSSKERKVTCAHDLRKDADGRLVLPPDSVYIGSAYKLNEGLGWVGASPYCIPKDLRDKERPYATASRQEREADRAKSVRALRERLEADRRGLERMALELGGKKLVCWCRTDDLCHGPILLELAETEQKRQADADKFGAIRVPSFSK